jgi:hypothetical protein
MSLAARSADISQGMGKGFDAVKGVAMKPGQTVTTCTRPRRRTRRLSIHVLTAALDAEYAPVFGIPRKPATLETATSDPDPAASIAVMKGARV